MTEENSTGSSNTNVLGPLLMIREAVKYFGPRGGSIINNWLDGVAIDPAEPVDLRRNERVPSTQSTGGARKGVGAEQKIRVNSINRRGQTATEGARAAGIIGSRK